MHIGLLSYRSNPFSGGQGIYVKHLSSALLSLGHKVDVLSGPPYPEIHKNINLIKIPSLNLFELEDNLRLRSFKFKFLLNSIDLSEWFGVLSGGFPEPFTFGERVDSYLKKNKNEYDLILDNQSLSYALINIQKRTPLVSVVHHPITKDHKLELESAKSWKQRLSTNRWHSFLKMQKKVAPQLNKIICPSNQSKEDVISEFKTDTSKVDVILNGIDLETFNINNEIKKVPFKIVTTASADIPLKGLRYLISALPSVLKDYPECTLSVIGRAKARGEIAKQIQRLGLESKISFHSELSEADIVYLYSSAEIAVIPSLYEGFGFGAGEAMACGVPLISTHSGGLKEVVGKAAIEVKPRDSEGISNAIVDLFSNPDKREHYTKVGRERMEKEFQWLNTAKKYVEIFEEEIDKFNSN